jgi:hypothetical protein
MLVYFQLCRFYPVFRFLFQCLVLGIAGLYSFSSSAQDSVRVVSAPSVTRFLEVGLSANAYRGDLVNRYAHWNSALQVGLKLNFKKRINSHLNLGLGSVSGQNMEYTFGGETGRVSSPNTYFSTSFVALNYDLQLHLLKYRGWMVYLSQGFGLIRFTPKDADKQSLLMNFASRAGDETYSNIAVLLPTQAGINYVFPNGYGIGVQAGWLNPQTDYLDNISRWGNREKRDNLLNYRFTFMAPLTFRD